MKPEFRQYFSAKAAIEGARDQFDRAIIVAEQAILAVVTNGKVKTLKVKNKLPYHNVDKDWTDTITGVTSDTKGDSPIPYLAVVLANGDNVPVDELEIGLRSDVVLSVAMPRT